MQANLTEGPVIKVESSVTESRIKTRKVVRAEELGSKAMKISVEVGYI